jgi:hypothetical protein
LPGEATAAARRAGENPVEKLAKFFPTACPLRMAVRLTRSAGEKLSVENTVIEFGTAREVLFACSQPLEFADLIRLQNSDGSLDVEASVVAVQYHNGQTAVAARFTREVANWIVKP